MVGFAQLKFGIQILNMRLIFLRLLQSINAAKLLIIEEPIEARAMNQNISNIVRNIRSVFIKSAEEIEIESSIRELKKYTDAELNDLGISRLCIEECVRGEAANCYKKAG